MEELFFLYAAVVDDEQGSHERVVSLFLFLFFHGCK